MSSRRGWGEDGIFFKHTGLCRDTDRHRHCPAGGAGHQPRLRPGRERIRRKVSGKTRAVVQERLKALVFATRTGAALDAANVRREFRAACTAAGIGPAWTPRELRHSFVSLMSSTGVPVEEIARLAGHTSTRTTEIVYPWRVYCRA